ncbi:MAG: Methyltransferase domain [Candidatus Diapherotrites archaeon]|nr:Methyltransferase domain [Candidatus Diapherotrites archaeon]MDN5366977.1 Methyltransferase domain [Candidatus Diapherotrites archaeon]
MMKGGIADYKLLISVLNMKEEWKGQLRISTNYTHSVVTALGIKEGHRVLDVGCGPGYHSAVAHVLGAEVHAIDLNKKNVETAKKLIMHLNELKEAKKLELPGDPAKIQKIILNAMKNEPPKKLPERAHIYHGDAAELDRHISDKDEYFDVALVIDVLHLVNMQRGPKGIMKVLKQVHKKLKPGGKLVAFNFEPGIQNYINKILERWGYQRIGLSEHGITEHDKLALKHVWIKPKV